MLRREFIKGWGALLLSAPAFARESCSSGSAWQPSVCTAQVDLNTVVYAAQEQLFWCWAAAAEMIFSVYGYEVAQEDIVTEVYGGPYNVPSGPTSNITAILSREWEDRNGRRFRSELNGLYDYFFGITALDNSQIIAALAHDQPLFYCNKSHAMVQRAISYAQTPYGLNIVNIGLVDPWPGEGARGPRYGEMTPAHMGGNLTYLAYPVITDLD